jgi:hypothetical protein
MAAGLGIDDGAAVHFQDARARAVITARAQANAYDVMSSNGIVRETALEVERINLASEAS